MKFGATWAFFIVVVFANVAFQIPFNQQHPTEAFNNQNSTVPRERSLIETVTIEADKAERVDHAHLVVFIGRVVARQYHWLLSAERLEVKLDQTGDRILRATATGHVRIWTSDCREGAAERAEYRALDERVVLSGGGARLWPSENSSIDDDIFIYLPKPWLRARSVCFGGVSPPR
jgi:lipopolysaccharide transport protein LptA